MISTSLVARGADRHLRPVIRIGSRVVAWLLPHAADAAQVPGPSLDPLSCAAVRVACDLLPNWLLRLAMLVARCVLLVLLLIDQRYSVRPLSPVHPDVRGVSGANDDAGHATAEVDVLSFEDGDDIDAACGIDGHRRGHGSGGGSSSSSSSRSCHSRVEQGPTPEDVAIYIHGGGFNFCDSADLLLADHLLPRLSERLASVPTNMRPRLYSIRYPTVAAPVLVLPRLVRPWAWAGAWAGAGDDATPTSELESTHAHVLAAFRRIEAGGRRRVVAVLGDSAGGNLALGLVLTLQAQGVPRDRLPSLCLLSPWVDPFSVSLSRPPVPAVHSSSSNNRDMLSPAWLVRCRRAFLGLSASATAADLDEPARQAELMARRLSASGVQVVAFDMDQCMVATHSRGRLSRTTAAVADFAAQVTPDFVLAARALHARGVRLAVATHSDAHEHGLLRPASRYVVGEPLVRMVLALAVPDLLDAFHVVAYNPQSRGNRDPLDANKRRHVRDIARHYGCARAEVVLFDDDAGNVTNTGGHFSAVQVDARCGFRLVPALEVLRVTPPMCARLRPSHLPAGPSVSTSATASASASASGVCASTNASTAACRVPLSVLAAPALATDIQLCGLPPMMVVAGARELLFPDIVRFVERARSAQVAAWMVAEGGAAEREGETEGGWTEVGASMGVGGEMRQQQQQPHHRDSVHSLHSVDSHTLSSSVGPWDEDTAVGHRVELLVGENDVHVYPVLWRSVLQRVLCPLGLLPAYLHARAWLMDAVTADVTPHHDREPAPALPPSLATATASEERGALAIDSIALFVAETAMRARASDSDAEAEAGAWGGGRVRSACVAAVAMDVGVGVGEGVPAAAATADDVGSGGGADSDVQGDSDANPDCDPDGGNDDNDNDDSTFVPPPNVPGCGRGHGYASQDALGTDGDESLLSIEEVDMEELQELLLLEGEVGTGGGAGAGDVDVDGGGGGGGMWGSLWGGVDDDEDGSVVSSVASVASYDSYGSGSGGASVLAKKMR